MTRLHEIAQALVTKGKGILAADESTGTIGKRFDSINIENTEANRQAYRDMLFTSAGIEKYISGVILFDETLRQKGLDGKLFADTLSAKGIIPGIKVDLGVEALANSPAEKITKGLDGLRERLQEYAKLGAGFAKWRAVIEIDSNDLPTDYAIHANAEALARYAALCQEAGIVPIVEPEVLMDGSHTIGRCEEVTARVLKALFASLKAHRVDLKGTLLKPNMVIAGLKCPTQNSPEEVAAATLRVFNATVPAEVAGVVFLSGGMSDEAASANLGAMNRSSNPWPLSFSYGRALQAASLKAWSGKAENVKAGQAAFMHRAHMNSLAATGDYTTSAEAA